MELLHISCHGHRRSCRDTRDAERQRVWRRRNKRQSGSRGSDGRRGQTLLELVAATTILAITLVPALRIMRDSLSVSQEIEKANQMSSFCVSRLEEQMATTSGSWAETRLTGDYAAQGYPTLHYEVFRSDERSDGGIPGALMVIRTTVWDDENDNNSLDAGEPNVSYRTKIGNFASYADAANN